MQDSNKSVVKSTHKLLYVAGWEVDPALSRMNKGDLVVKLEPKVMELLLCLVSRPGEVFTREEIEAQVWAGMVVGYDSLTSAMIKLRKAFGDDPHHPRVIETVSKKGYRLICEVNLAEAEQHSPTTINNVDAEVASVNEAKLSARKNLNYILAISSFLVALIVLIFVSDTSSFFGDTVSEINSDKKSIAVLSFQSLNKDPVHEDFVDGISQDIITDLSRISKMFVISSTSSFKYKGQDISPEIVRNELGVDYMLQGNIRTIGEQIRINAHLVDTNTGYQIWAERYDREKKDIFLVQDELTRNIVNALELKLTSREEELLIDKPVSNFEAYELFIKGQRLFRERTQDANKEAQIAFKEAIKLDPYFARAYGSYAVSMAADYRRGWAEYPTESLDRALHLARQAVELDQSQPHTHWALGYVHLFRKEYEQAAEHVQMSIKIAPSYADGYGMLAFINNHLGKADKAIDQVQKGMKLNPYYSWDYPFNLGWAYYTVGEYEEAVEALEKAKQRNENVVYVRLYLLASYLRLGRVDDAEWEAEQLQIIAPNMTISHLNKVHTIREGVIKQSFFNDLKQAGIPQ
ncbi:MAG: winged helix-turn-helix domain-containing protein [Gammaproteobacteria bacterium]|nr:winged helix-turn-helix domain-containing protein [Gammaproteobacteria bacterium]